MLLTSVAFSSISNAFAQEDLSVFGYWNFHEGMPAASLYRHLYQQATDQLGKRQEAVKKLQTKSDWQKRQALVGQKLAEAMGPFPAKTPLNPVITGSLERDDFRVEKLYFESRPGYYVTAALFLPKNKPGKLPAILYCSGHSANGFRSDVYQHTILNYVKKGFVVLAFDPIGQGERRQYLDTPDKSSPTKDHSYSGTQAFVSGMSPANYFVWDGIRAVDYLLTRAEVDPARIGITGRSGGGTQTAYLAALDDRILAAAPECFITTTDKLWQANGPQDAEQNLSGFLEKGLDFPDLIEVRAPKPTLLVSTTRDMFPIQGVRDTYAEAKPAFAAYGKAGHLQKVEDDAPHASTPKNREATYTFFQKYLANPGSSEDLEVAIFWEKELYATPTGNVFQDLKSESIFSLNRKYTQEMVQKRTEQQKTNPLNPATLRTLAMSLTGYQKPTAAEPVFSGRMQRAEYAIEKYMLKGVGNYYLPVLRLKPTKTNGKTLLLLDEQGKAVAAQRGTLADQLAGQGYEVVIPDLSGYGELGNGYMKGGDAVLEGIPLNVWYAGIQTGKNLVGVRAGEIALLTDFIQKTSASSQSLSAVASGTLTSDLLHAATFANPFTKIILINPLLSYQSIAETPNYKPKYVLSCVPGALAAYDLPDLVAALPARTVLLVNPVNATGEEVDLATCTAVYGQALSKNPAPSAEVRQAVGPTNMADSIGKWIR
ncbi:MAG: acetylxylan esterase [Bacteroidetes bacterium]|nr:acetylxylan esterase [Bacteroidota bacterium]